ncbi:pimeloyl-ACP methyl ester carboxylesterase [Paenibacillus forsythiae]|uniref:Pimeloyl-ACP methyl ester carboxylesterase n=1 Tax=Paenibacillus forsythiae TaxID=365616 RepID=A0ABU3H7G9_9BACL|nr:alpha/beta hydrolase [Paenibacillus forsythiae]MDT3426774.1 pimeloyl-ACP methyl ester carboxylesterase [Paenibacillus forsythiae]
MAKTYGKPPYQTFLIHGGPGAAGEMAGVATFLSQRFGVVESFQTRLTINELILELKKDIEHYSDGPVSLVGYSWGAWLSYIFAASFPELVRKSILVGSAPYKQHYTKDLQATRLARLSEEDKRRVRELEAGLEKNESNKNEILRQYGKLMEITDLYDPLPSDDGMVEFNLNVYHHIWQEADALRSSGELLKLGYNVVCPVVAIHGVHDPHPYSGVIQPLSAVLQDFRYHLLEHCGHTPWKERLAKDHFYHLLLAELPEKIFEV